MTGLPLSATWKGDSYNLILVIIDHLTKIMYYKSSKITINASRLTKIIIDMIMQYYGLMDSIISDCGAIFTSKFWSLLYYFLSIKKQLFIIFYLQTNR